MYCMNQCELNQLAAAFKSQHDDIRNNKDQVQLFLSFFPPWAWFTILFENLIILLADNSGFIIQ